MPKARRKPRSDALDPVVMTVIANRLDGVVREMTNTPLRAARSAVISSARDFSCCILTGDNHLLASAEGLPVHIFGAHLQGENMCRYHGGGDIREGDAYLDNDPYGGNTHPADHTFLVPVFIGGEHLLPSRPGEFHPEPLTDPDVILSHHPARATARRLPPSVESFKAPPVAGWRRPLATCPLRSASITPASSLVRGSPPLSGASVLSASRVLRLCFLPWHRRPGSQVPYESPNEN